MLHASSPLRHTIKDYSLTHFSHTLPQKRVANWEKLCYPNKHQSILEEGYSDCQSNR